METRLCVSCKKQFSLDATDLGFYEKMGVPPPALCPECRFKRRAVFRNERTLYKNTCKLCGKSVVTMFHPRSPYIIYCNDCWLSDKWDAKTYAQSYDSSRPFFDQLGELSQKVPKSATYSSIHTGPNINSEYTNFAGGNKDCYLCFNSGPKNENCAYSRGLMNSRDTFDTYFGQETERTYEGVNVQKNSGVAWGQNILECLDSWFLLNCSGVQNCFGCVNLRHKSYYFLNERLSKDEWKKKVSEIVGSYRNIENFKKKFEEHFKKFPRRENNNLKSVNSTGEYIFESKNCQSVFEVANGEDLRYVFSVKVLKDSYDQIGHGRNSELLLEGVGVGVSQKVIAGWWVESCHNVEYSFATRSSEYCFGCDGVRNGKYSILNKQYGEEEYKKLRVKIIEELKSKNLYGLFMPPELAFFGYNETVGQDNLPLIKEEVLAQGFRWQDDIPATRGQETLKPEQIPDHIKDVSDSILRETLACVSCGRNYRLIKPELEMYRKALIPIPRRCFNCRHTERLVRRGPFKLFDRKCDKCGKGIKTNFAPDRPEIVYCESCYQNEVI
ncbi:MAG: hypothetical protein A3B25_01230 [Candidatus Ryanbacteria bacterium RIFCSPLOWO2_01_FULL_48_26]|uniref:Zinc-binding domain-containing protein n=1 Tax=Candidatus Ryanbacteria bacterium RIFCSPLOWO2_01_FULL_48_26 TaxID=1802126 RepID=A0A1G2GTW9_9BACT|nr:MAG: hypothetical protein A3B25_01230 [Candidatus Ryanbacteria bacterium RIFCSPLOWO2_01_FULL_48_26]